MTDEKRCEPPPELRDRDGWHWVETLDGQYRFCHRWWKARGEWCWATLDARSARALRYLAPVTPPATVAALVEALEGLMRWHPAKDTISRMGLKPEPAEAAYEAARAALAAYREAGR